MICLINQANIKLLTLNVNMNSNYSLRMTFLTEQGKKNLKPSVNIDGKISFSVVPKPGI